MTTALLQVAHWGNSNITQALLNKHANPESGEENWVDDASNEGMTPLLAALSEVAAIVQQLLSTGKAELIKLDGIDVNAQNIDGHTALVFAYNGKNQVETSSLQNHRQANNHIHCQSLRLILD